MNISFDKEHKTFSVETEESGYYIALADGADFAGHVHYGKKLGGRDDLVQLLRVNEHPFTPSKLKREKLSFFDAFQWEYPCGGIGDYRESALDIRNGDAGAARHGLPCCPSGELLGRRRKVRCGNALLQPADLVLGRHRCCGAACHTGRDRARIPPLLYGCARQRLPEPGMRPQHTLQEAGLLLPRPWGDFQSRLVHLKSGR